MEIIFILINKQKEFTKLDNNISIDEKLLKKKLLFINAINNDEEGYYNKIIDEIIPLILDYDKFYERDILNRRSSYKIGNEDFKILNDIGAELNELIDNIEKIFKKLREIVLLKE
jgi:hypothetical protein